MCSSATATCNNGSWTVQNFATIYTKQSCTNVGNTCAGYALSSTGAHGVYDSCTIYADNTCAQ
ncbi:hypothetical protein J6V86_00115 [bacterium]|nr:hypothetical protein [bacterium]